MDEERTPAGDSTRDRVQAQFGRAAEAYVASPSHAQGASLARLVELAALSPSHRVLDVATSVGHTALAVAPHVAYVLGIDLTPEMLQVARRLAREREVNNVEFRPGDAEALPAEDASFDRVVCRIALHHFPNPLAAAREMARVVVAGGRIVLVDNIVPQSPEPAAFINRFETLRDPSHHWVFPLTTLAGLFRGAGLTVVHTETLTKSMDFRDWTARMSVPPSLEKWLWESLEGASDEVRAFLEPRQVNGRPTFTLHEGIVVAVKDQPAPRA
ncbi:MAG: methyltransferase domain-containing protein [Anaerolineae bacterium]